MSVWGKAHVVLGLLVFLKALMMMMMFHWPCCNLHSVVCCSSFGLPLLLPCHLINDDGRWACELTSACGVVSMPWNSANS